MQRNPDIRIVATCIGLTAAHLRNAEHICVRMALAGPRRFRYFRDSTVSASFAALGVHAGAHHIGNRA